MTAASFKQSPAAIRHTEIDKYASRIAFHQREEEEDVQVERDVKVWEGKGEILPDSLAVACTSEPFICLHRHMSERGG